MTDQPTTSAVSESKLKRILRRVGRVFAWLSALLIVAVLSGAAYQALASSAHSRGYPAPGELVDVGGHSLHLWCSGSGSPTVVFESGLGGFSFDWSFVREDISEHARVCTYDRAGYGWSDPVDAPQSSTEVAKNLNDLLNGAGESGPYLLVGHSAGGLYVRAFASLYPGEVAGMVLLDSSHENQGLRLTAFESVEEQQLGQLELCSMVSRIGLMRVLGVHDASLPGDVPLADDEVAAWRGHLYGNAFCGVVAREFEALMVEIRQNQSPRPLGDIPLVVMTRDVTMDEVQEGAGIDAETLEDAGEIAFELQRELARLSTTSSHQIVAESGHYIHWDQPEAVIDTIVETIASIQTEIDGDQVEGEEDDI